MIEAEGRLGASVTFDGQVVTIRRKGFRGSLVGRGEQQIHVGQLGAIEWKAPGRITREGFIRFVVVGTVARRARVGQRNTDARTDEWAVVFWHKDTAAFEQLREAVQVAIAAKYQGGQVADPAQPDVIDQLRKLGELRAAGIVTEAEFAAHKQKLLNG
jgi:hypothetical protein